jgi:tRNA-dihydrouridine synthase 3
MIDVILQGEGSALMGRTHRFQQVIESMTKVMDIPLTVKIRTGIYESKNIAHQLIPKLKSWGASMVTVGIPL